jgi:hypothetical protein
MYPATKWIADAGIGDTLNTLLTPVGKRLFAAHRAKQVDLTVYCLGPNARALGELYTPMVRTIQTTALDLPIVSGTRVSADWALTPLVYLPEEPPDFCFSPEERDRARTFLDQLRRPVLMIQEIAGGQDGPLQARKLWGGDRYQEIAKRWGEHLGGSVCDFGTISTIGLPVAGPLRQALAIASLLGTEEEYGFFLCPESAAKYLGPLFGMRGVVLWSQFHDFEVVKQWAQWYQPFDRLNRGRQVVLAPGTVDCKELSVEMVWAVIGTLYRRA